MFLDPPLHPGLVNRTFLLGTIRTLSFGGDSSGRCTCAKPELRRYYLYRDAQRASAASLDTRRKNGADHVPYCIPPDAVEPARRCVAKPACQADAHRLHQTKLA